VTKDEARKILERKSGNWIDTDDDGNPDWHEWGGAPAITLDGDFTLMELLAIIAFYPGAEVQGGT
jgi:hypothetical protein